VAAATGFGTVAAGAYLMRGLASGPDSGPGPAFEVPVGACDSHVHIVGDPARFPLSPDRDYTPPPATAEDLSEMLRHLRCDRVVIVTPTAYGADNAATLDAIRFLGRDRACGVALVDGDTRPATLDRLRDGGIAGLRVLLYSGDNFNPTKAMQHLQIKTDFARPRHWHLDIATTPDVIAALYAPLAASPVPIVFDYFGWIGEGLDQPGAEAVLSLVRSGRAYIKLSEPYRLSRRGPDYPDLAPIAQAIVAANPDRVLWGSGWPHVGSPPSGRKPTELTPNVKVDTVHLLDLLADWVPDAATRHKILVENPARFYGFGSSA
jgi:predicted TIM-barrel fold metal-dependent hydrolase